MAKENKPEQKLVSDKEAAGLGIFATVYAVASELKRQVVDPAIQEAQKASQPVVEGFVKAAVEVINSNELKEQLKEQATTAISNTTNNYAAALPLLVAKKSALGSILDATSSIPFVEKKNVLVKAARALKHVLGKGEKKGSPGASTSTGAPMPGSNHPLPTIPEDFSSGLHQNPGQWSGAQRAYAEAERARLASDTSSAFQGAHPQYNPGFQGAGLPESMKDQIRARMEAEANRRANPPAQGPWQEAPQGGWEEPAQGDWGRPAQGGWEEPAQGDWGGPARDAWEGSAQDATQGAAQGAYQASAPGSAQGATQGSTQGAAQGAHQASAPGSAQGAAQGSTQGAAQGSTQGAAQGSTQGAAQGSTQGAAQGSAQGAAQSSAQGAAQSSAQEAAQSSARDSAREAAGEAARDAAGEAAQESSVSTGVEFAVAAGKAGLFGIDATTWALLVALSGGGVMLYTFRGKIFGGDHFQQLKGLVDAKQEMFESKLSELTSQTTALSDQASSLTAASAQDQIALGLQKKANVELVLANDLLTTKLSVLTEKFGVPLALYEGFAGVLSDTLGPVIAISGVGLLVFRQFNILKTNADDLASDKQDEENRKEEELLYNQKQKEDAYQKTISDLLERVNSMPRVDSQQVAGFLIKDLPMADTPSIPNAATPSEDSGGRVKVEVLPLDNLSLEDQLLENMKSKDLKQAAQMKKTK